MMIVMIACTTFIGFSPMNAGIAVRPGDTKEYLTSPEIPA